MLELLCVKLIFFFWTAGQRSAESNVFIEAVVNIDLSLKSWAICGVSQFLQVLVQEHSFD